MENPTLMQAARTLLKKHEGTEYHVYRDTTGHATIGVGFNLDQPGARAMISAVGANYDALLAGNADLTPEQSDALLARCIINCLEWLVKVFPDFDEYSLNRQVALVDMAFMGQGAFLGFQDLIADVRAGRWQGAAWNAVNSLWAKQVGERADDDAAMLGKG